jgi:hypothetical protein
METSSSKPGSPTRHAGFKDGHAPLTAGLSQRQKWWTQAQKDGLICPQQVADPNRSQGATGVSIDWLKQFSDSFTGVQMPTATHAIVREAVLTATAEQSCKLVDLIPPVSRSWWPGVECAHAQQTNLDSPLLPPDTAGACWLPLNVHLPRLVRLIPRDLMP